MNVLSRYSREDEPSADNQTGKEFTEDLGDIAAFSTDGEALDG